MEEEEEMKSSEGGKREGEKGGRKKGRKSEREREEPHKQGFSMCLSILLVDYLGWLKGKGEKLSRTQAEVRQAIPSHQLFFT